MANIRQQDLLIVLPHTLGTSPFLPNVQEEKHFSAEYFPTQVFCVKSFIKMWPCGLRLCEIVFELIAKISFNIFRMFRIAAIYYC